jgi:hypothetical protein
MDLVPVNHRFIGEGVDEPTRVDKCVAGDGMSGIGLVCREGPWHYRNRQNW